MNEKSGSCKCVLLLMLVSLAIRANSQVEAADRSISQTTNSRHSSVVSVANDDLTNDGNNNAAFQSAQRKLAGGHQSRKIVSSSAIASSKQAKPLNGNEKLSADGSTNPRKRPQTNNLSSSVRKSRPTDKSSLHPSVPHDSSFETAASRRGYFSQPSSPLSDGINTLSIEEEQQHDFNSEDPRGFEFAHPDSRPSFMFKPNEIQQQQQQQQHQTAFNPSHSRASQMLGHEFEKERPYLAARNDKHHRDGFLSDIGNDPHRYLSDPTEHDGDRYHPFETGTAAVDDPAASTTGKLPLASASSIKVVFNNNPQFIIGRDQHASGSNPGHHQQPQAADLAGYASHLHKAKHSLRDTSVDRDTDESHQDETKISAHAGGSLSATKHACNTDHNHQGKTQIPNMEQIDLTSQEPLKGVPPGLRDQVKKEPSLPPPPPPPPEIKTTRIESQQLDDQVITPFEQMAKSGNRPPLRMVISMRNKNGDTMKVPVNLHGSSKKQLPIDLGSPMQVHFEPPIVQQQQQQHLDDNTPPGGDVFDPSIVKPFPKSFKGRLGKPNEQTLINPIQPVQLVQQQKPEDQLPLQSPLVQPQKIDEEPQSNVSDKTPAQSTESIPSKRTDCVEQQQSIDDTKQQQQQQQAMVEPQLAPMIVDSGNGGILHMMVPKLTSFQNKTFASMFAQFQKALTEQMSLDRQQQQQQPINHDDPDQQQQQQQQQQFELQGRKLESPDSLDGQQQQQRSKQQSQDDQEDLLVAMLAANVTGGPLQQQIQQQQIDGKQQHMSMTVIKPPKGTTLSEAIRKHAQVGPANPGRTIAILQSIGSKALNRNKGANQWPDRVDIQSVPLLPSSRQPFSSADVGPTTTRAQVDEESAAPIGFDIRLKQDGNRNPSQRRPSSPIPVNNNNNSNNDSNNNNEPVDPDGFSSSSEMQQFYRSLFGGQDDSSSSFGGGGNLDEDGQDFSSSSQGQQQKRYKRSADINNNNSTTTTTTTTSSSLDAYGKMLEPSDKLSSQALKVDQIDKSKKTKRVKKITAPKKEAQLKKPKQQQQQQLMNKRMGSSAPSATGATDNLKDFFEPAASEESEQRENEVPDYADDSADDDTDASDSNEEPSSSTNSGGSDNSGGGGGGGGNDYSSGGSDSDSDDSDSDSDLYSDGSGGFGDESADDEPFNQAAASSSAGDYTASGSFEIPQIEINPNTLKQDGCRTVVKEVQEIPMNGLGVVQSNGQPGSGFAAAASNPQARSYSVAGLRRVRRHSDNLINSRKVTSIVMTKECHFPNSAASQSKPTTTTTSTTKTKTASKQSPHQTSSLDRRWQPATLMAPPPISMESNEHRLSAHQQNQGRSLQHQQQRQNQQRFLPQQQQQQQQSNQMNPLYHHKFDPNLNAAARHHNQMLLQHQQQQQQHHRQQQQQQHQLLPFLQSQISSNPAPAIQVNQIRRRSVANQQQPIQPIQKTPLQRLPSRDGPARKQQQQQIQQPEVNVGADSRRTEVIAQKLYKPPSADNPYHVLSISSKSGVDPDMESDEDDSFVMDNDSNNGDSGNENQKSKSKQRQPDRASSRQHRMRETLSETERKALTDPNYDDTDPVNHQEARRHQQRKQRQQHQHQQEEEEQEEQQPKRPAASQEQDADENDADLADESSNTRQFRQTHQPQTQMQPHLRINNNNNRSLPPVSAEARLAEQARRMEAAAGAAASRLQQQQQQQQHNYRQRHQHQQPQLNQRASEPPPPPEQRFGRSFKFEHQVGRPQPSGLMAQLQSLKPGRQGFVSIAQSPPRQPERKIQLAANKRNDNSNDRDADEDEDADDEDSSVGSHGHGGASSNRDSAAEDPDSDPEYNPRESHLPAHTKPKRVQKSFAYVHRDLPRDGSPNSPDDFVVSYGRGNLQTEHEDYDSDREQPASTSNNGARQHRDQDQDQDDERRRRAATTQQASYLAGPLRSSLSSNPITSGRGRRMHNSPVAAAAAAAAALDGFNRQHAQLTPAADDAYPYQRQHQHHNHNLMHGNLQAPSHHSRPLQASGATRWHGGTARMSSAI